MTTKKEPVKEVWLFLVLNSYGPSCDCRRVFAEMGEREINIIAKEVSGEYDHFREAIEQYFAKQLRDELAKGETEVRISPNDSEETEYVITKYEIDSGTDWGNAGDCKKPDEEDRIDVYVGDNIFATEDYFGNVEAFYSAEFWEEMTPFTIE